MNQLLQIRKCILCQFFVLIRPYASLSVPEVKIFTSFVSTFYQLIHNLSYGSAIRYLPA